VCLEFSGEVRSWRRHPVVAVREQGCGAIAAASAILTSGWGMVPVTARNGGTESSTSLVPQQRRPPPAAEDTCGPL